MKKLEHLALSDTGFLFDPATGNTYTLNDTCVQIFNLLKADKTRKEIISAIVDEYEVENDQAERDYSDLMIRLKEFKLIENGEPHNVTK